MAKVFKTPIDQAESMSTKLEPTAKNAIAFAKREMFKYATQPGAYGKIPGLVDATSEMYHLRDDEKQKLTETLTKHAQNDPIYKGWYDD